MLRLYSLLGILQLFCLYHAFKNRKESYWYFVIFFLPGLGTAAYVYMHFLTKNNIDKVSETIKSTVNPKYSINSLLKEAKYSDTITNKEKLADAYASKGQYHQSIALYESCLEGFNAGDLGIQEKLMVARYFVDDFEGVVKVGNELEGKKAFAKSESRVVYAWSLFYLGADAKSDKVFQSMDIRYGNYVQRAEFAKYLIETHREREAKSLLISIQDEFDGMDKIEFRQKKEIRKEISGLMKAVDSY